MKKDWGKRNQDSLIYENSLNVWFRLTPAQQAVTPRPTFQATVPPVKTSATEPVLEKTFNTELLASTYIGTIGLDIGWGIDVDANSNVFVAGYTDNVAFPTTACAIDQSYNGTTDGDYFFLKFNSALSTLKYSTLIGGNDQDYWEPKIKLFGTTCEQSAICSGTSHSINFPTISRTL